MNDVVTGDEQRGTRVAPEVAGLGPAVGHRDGEPVAVGAVEDHRLLGPAVGPEGGEHGVATSGGEGQGAVEVHARTLRRSPSARPEGAGPGAGSEGAGPGAGSGGGRSGCRVGAGRAGCRVGGGRSGRRVGAGRAGPGAGSERAGPGRRLRAACPRSPRHDRVRATRSDGGRSRRATPRPSGGGADRRPGSPAARARSPRRYPGPELRAVAAFRLPHVLGDGVPVPAAAPGALAQCGRRSSDDPVEVRPGRLEQTDLAVESGPGQRLLVPRSAGVRCTEVGGPVAGHGPHHVERTRVEPGSDDRAVAVPVGVEDLEGVVDVPAPAAPAGPVEGGGEGGSVYPPPGRPGRPVTAPSIRRSARGRMSA